MAKYRKLPVVIDAEQWWNHNDCGLPLVSRTPLGLKYAEIETLEGTMRVDEGDWVITGVNGERYPCKPDIFKKTYERYTRSSTPCP